MNLKPFIDELAELIADKVAKKIKCPECRYEKTIIQPIKLSGYLRINQIVGDPKAGIPALIPVAKSTWWAGVKSGKYPQPIKLSDRVTVWRAEDIKAYIENYERT